MSDTDLISRIVALTKCGTHISINEHRDYYETVDQFLSRDYMPDLDPEVRRVMIKTDTTVRVICYADTPVGSYDITHHDLTAALTEMLRVLEGRDG